MNVRNMTTVMVAMAAWLLGVQAYAVSAADEPPTVPPPVPMQEQPEVLTRGPVHEAFAQPVAMENQPAVVAPTPPPPAVQEAPPSQKPQGDNYVWVPGYWAWDADRREHIWISACWRLAPPGRVWVPGYWSQTPAGWQWVAGFWAPSGSAEMVYLPPPPPRVDATPIGVAPTPDSIWVSPCHYWRNGQYILRAGYWLRADPEWVWVPSHYVMTPHGYVFVAGHWDYAMEHRGVLFAPVYFPHGIHLRIGFVFSPSIVVNLGRLQFSLFSYPRYCHYYFGDYYDDLYVRIGIYPRYECDRFRSWYDPIYVHERWHHRAEPQWEVHVRAEFDRRRSDVALRPPRTYHDMETRVARAPEPQRADLRFAQPMSVVTADKTSSRHFEPVDSSMRQRITEHTANVQRFRDDRNHWEAPRTTPTPPPPSQPGAKPSRPATAPEPRKAIPTSPQETKAPMPTPPRSTPSATQPAERKAPMPTPPRMDTAQPRDRQTPTAPPGGFRLTKPDHVKIPVPPNMSRPDAPGSREKRPPSSPSDEDGRRGDFKDKGGPGGPGGSRGK